MARPDDNGPLGGRPVRLGQPQQDVALRYARDAERHLRKLRKALRKGSVPRSTDLLAALESDAARVGSVLAFADAGKARAVEDAPSGLARFDKTAMPIATRDDEAVDEMERESFPASDPPSRWAGP